ncbi:hypothetical protein IAD21_00846 [Abditibacteriota bacterium]|nr:hypothetical protein IAD21_00846 [Abditibacteriota bacterium]
MPSLEIKNFVLRVVLMGWLLLVAVTPGWSHPMPSSAVLLHLHNTGIDAQLYLPIIELRLGWEKPVPMDAVKAVREYGPGLKGYVLKHIHPVAPDGRPWTVTVHKITPVVEQIPDMLVDVTMTPPPGAPADRLTLNYDVIFHKLITHTAIVSVVSDWHNGQLDGKPVLLGTMRDISPSLVIDRSQGNWWRGFVGVLRLGVRHIAEGTDHLMFLLALLLPAPLLAVGNRWGGYAGGKTALWRITKVVSAFTIGHSITLIFGALGWVHLPSAFIESAIALSIFISAIHALVPIFRGKEVFIAAGFGLVHGLAFASTLTEFGFDPITMVSSVFAFNIGIEVMQLLVILVTMPWLVLLASTRLYPPLRVVGACITGVAAASWFFERAFGCSNPIGPLVESVAANALWLVVGLATVAVGATLIPKARLATPITPAECQEAAME